jgi:hypothetical protein
MFMFYVNTTIKNHFPDSYTKISKKNGIDNEVNGTTRLYHKMNRNDCVPLPREAITSDMRPNVGRVLFFQFRSSLRFWTPSRFWGDLGYGSVALIGVLYHLRVAKVLEHNDRGRLWWKYGWISRFARDAESVDRSTNVFTHFFTLFPLKLAVVSRIGNDLPEHCNGDDKTDDRSLRIVFATRRPQPTLTRRQTKCLQPSLSPSKFQSTALEWPHLTSCVAILRYRTRTDTSRRARPLAMSRPVMRPFTWTADVATCHVALGVDVEYVNGLAQTCNAVVQNRMRTMADEMAQMVPADKAVRKPAALTPTADSTSGPSTEPNSSKADSQVRTIIVPADLGQVSSNDFIPR